MFCKIHGIFVYVIKRTVHGRLEIEQDMEFIFLCSNRLKTVNSWDIDLDLTVEDKFHISGRPCIILYLFSSALRLIYHIDYEQSLFFLGSSSKTPETRKWPRAWLKLRRRERLPPSFLASRVSRLASRSFAAQRSRARALPLPNLKKRRDCSQSIYHMPFLATASLKKEQRVKNNVQWDSALVQPTPL